MRGLVLVASCGVTVAAAGQTPAPATNGRLVFEFDRVLVSPANPSVTLRIYADWDEVNPGDWMFGGTGYDLGASDGEFTAASLLLGTNPPNTPGTIAGSRVRGAMIGQALPPIPGCGITGVCRPVALAEYTWMATDFTPRTVSFASEGTSVFLLTPRGGGQSVNLVMLGEFTAGFGTITVVPAPAGIALLGVGGACVCGRRRR